MPLWFSLGAPAQGIPVHGNSGATIREIRPPAAGVGHSTPGWTSDRGSAVSGSNSPKKGPEKAIFGGTTRGSLVRQTRLSDAPWANPTTLKSDGHTPRSETTIIPSVLWSTVMVGFSLFGMTACRRLSSVLAALLLFWAFYPGSVGAWESENVALVIIDGLRYSEGLGDPTHAKMMMLMPVVFTFIFINFSSGLVLYWLVNNILSISQQYYVQKKTS